jgi:hypothetical protein
MLATTRRSQLVAHVGTILPLQQARAAHEMLNGAPHQRGKIVLNVAACRSPSLAAVGYLLYSASVLAVRLVLGRSAHVPFAHCRIARVA